MEKGKPATSDELSVEEMSTLIGILAREYKTTASSILSKLDSVSGDLDALHRLLSGDRTVRWTEEEDDLLHKNSDLIKKWKGAEQVELRRKYLVFKTK
jgi:hypothetical protein